MKTILTTLCFLCFSFILVAQNVTEEQIQQQDQPAATEQIEDQGVDQVPVKQPVKKAQAPEPIKEQVPAKPAVQEKLVPEPIKEKVLAKPAVQEAPMPEQTPPVETEDNSLYAIAQLMPQFPGGIDSMKMFINNNMNYDKIVKTKETDDLVRIEFVVEKDGTMSNIAILKSSGNKTFDNEAFRVINKMPIWQPGMMEGKVIRTKLIVPVRFVK